MKLKSKIMLSMAFVFVLFGIAIGVALTGMQSNKNRFERFLTQDLALAQEANSLYSQGLQMGQAVRNIVMDPSNKAAYKNLDAASAEFKKASPESSGTRGCKSGRPEGPAGSGCIARAADSTPRQGRVACK